ncbi:MAG: deoxyribonuclease IV [Deltaproteobacteria bacterium]|nr:deoxyribonuclease IV [Deltaproteobacteria bacterium]
MSVSKGFEKTYKETEKLGCQCIQIFVKNPRSWKRKKLKSEEIVTFRKLFSSLPVFSHLSYLPNLAKGSFKDISAFFEEIELSLELGIDCIVVHCGSRSDKEEGLIQVANALNEALKVFRINILIENSAGYKNSIGATLEEIARIFDKVIKKEYVKVCLDTAHLFQAGIDIRRFEVWDRLIEYSNQILGKGKIGLIHLNDSKTDLGSRVDRHWHIGRGKIGQETFRWILNDPRINDLCAVLETPEMGKMDHENMKMVRSLLLPLVSHSLS